MFEYLSGIVAYKKDDHIALDVNGVGYKIIVSLIALGRIQINEKAKFYIYNNIKEDSYDLIGFLEERERDLFQLLMSVKGVGATLAVSVISTFDVDTIRDLIANDDYKTLKKVPKLGEKKAQQIILDLKSKLKTLDKLSVSQRDTNTQNYLLMEEELYTALTSLGYKKAEVAKYISRDDMKNYATIEEAIKVILKKLNE